MKQTSRQFVIITICLMLSILAGLGPLSQVRARSKCKTAYSKILKKKGSSYAFSIKDINGDKTPELLIQEMYMSVTTQVYTFRKGKAVKTSGINIPADGVFYISENGKTFSYYRGGPAFEDGMPYTIVEQKLSGKKIKTVNTYSALVDTPSGINEYWKNNKSISRSAFSSAKKKLVHNRISFVKNTKKNRKKHGVN